MRRILYFLLFWLLAVPSAVQARRYTVMVSLDGFRRDYVRIYDTPFLNRLAREGVQVVLSGYVGPKAFEALTAAGIKVCQNVDDGSVREAVERFVKGELPFADAPNK